MQRGPGGGSGGPAGSSSLWIHGFRLRGWTHFHAINLIKTNNGVLGLKNPAALPVVTQRCFSSCPRGFFTSRQRAGIPVTYTALVS